MKRNKRSHSKSLVADYKIDSDSSETLDYVANVSEGGAFIETSKPLEPGTVVHMRIADGEGKNPIQLTGIVRWNRREVSQKLSTTGMGLEFIEMQPDLVLRWKETLKKSS